MHYVRRRGVTKALIEGGGGGGREYSCICVLPNELLLKSVVFKSISKEISRAEHEYEYIPPPPLIVLRPLVLRMKFQRFNLKATTKKVYLKIYLSSFQKNLLNLRASAKTKHATATRNTYTKKKFINNFNNFLLASFLANVLL